VCENNFPPLHESMFIYNYNMQEDRVFQLNYTIILFDYYEVIKFYTGNLIKMYVIIQ
jgi:hypothetical protein